MYLQKSSGVIEVKVPKATESQSTQFDTTDYSIPDQHNHDPVGNATQLIPTEPPPLIHITCETTRSVPDSTTQIPIGNMDQRVFFYKTLKTIRNHDHSVFYLQKSSGVIEVKAPKSTKSQSTQFEIKDYSVTKRQNKTSSFSKKHPAINKNDVYFVNEHVKKTILTLRGVKKPITRSEWQQLFNGSRQLRSQHKKWTIWSLSFYFPFRLRYIFINGFLFCSL